MIVSTHKISIFSHRGLTWLRRNISLLDTSRITIALSAKETLRRSRADGRGRRSVPFIKTLIHGQFCARFLCGQFSLIEINTSAARINQVLPPNNAAAAQKCRRAALKGFYSPGTWFRSRWRSKRGPCSLCCNVCMYNMKSRTAAYSPALAFRELNIHGIVCTSVWCARPQLPYDDAFC